MMNQHNRPAPPPRLSWPVFALLSLWLGGLGLWSGCQSAMPNSPKDTQIILREGDVVAIEFPSSTNLNTVQPIRRDGNLALPLVGNVYAVDLTPDQLQAKLVKLFEPQIPSKEITVSIQSSTYPVFVIGLVQRPGKILVTQPMTAMEAILDGGGFDLARANMSHVRVIRHVNGHTQSFTLNLKQELDGKEVTPFYLRPNDIIYVPEKFTWF